MKKLAYRIAMKASKRMIIKEHGRNFYDCFLSLSKKHLERIIPRVPDIGNSIFSINFDSCPSYIAWYKAYCELGLDSDAANGMIWKMNEALIKLVPGSLMKKVGRSYIKKIEKKAPVHEKLSEGNKVHPYDWKIRYRKIDDNTCETDIYECGMMKLCRDFDAMGLFPSMCRMDYLFSSYMGTGFKRTKTLGDGDDCCNCRYTVPGTCEWAPEKGFVDRK